MISSEITEAHIRDLYNCDNYISACKSLQGMAYQICIKCSTLLSAVDCTSTALYKGCAYDLMCQQLYKPEYTCPRVESTSDSPTGAIIGIAVGFPVLAVIIFIGCLIYKIRNRMRIGFQQQMELKQQYHNPEPIQQGPIQPQYYPKFAIQNQYPSQAFQQSPMPYNGQQSHMVIGVPLFR